MEEGNAPAQWNAACLQGSNTLYIAIDMAKDGSQSFSFTRLPSGYWKPIVVRSQTQTACVGYDNPSLMGRERQQFEKSKALAILCDESRAYVLNNPTESQ